MKKPRILFFYSKEKEKELGQEIFQASHPLCLPIEKSVDQKSFKPKNALIVICDSSKNEKGKEKLKDLRRKFPNIPLFLMVADPSKSYLRTALDAKISDLLPLPADRAVTLRIINESLKQNHRSSSYTNLKQWVFTAKSRVLSFFRNGRATAKPVLEEVSGLESLNIAPPHFLKLIGNDPEKQMTPDLSVQFFGQLDVKIRGKVVPNIRGRKNASVLAYLLFHHHKSVHRDILIDRFWGDFSNASAKNSLNVAICSIRKDLAKVLPEQEVILFERESYCINPQLEIVTDVEKFTYFWKKGRAIEEAQGLSNALHAYNKAIALYQKEFLEELRFEEWCESERANLREIYLFILNRLSAYFFEQKDYYGCINICRRMLSTDNCLEEVYRKLMKCYYALGITDMAFKQYFKCKQVLKAELDLDPSKPTEKLFASMQLGKAI